MEIFPSFSKSSVTTTVLTTADWGWTISPFSWNFNQDIFVLTIYTSSIWYKPLVCLKVFKSRSHSNLGTCQENGPRNNDYIKQVSYWRKDVKLPVNFESYRFKRHKYKKLNFLIDFYRRNRRISRRVYQMNAKREQR